MSTIIEQNIAENIKTLRKAMGLKQSELGEKISYSDKMISKWEKGVCIPDINALAAIARAFDLKVDDLIKDNAVNKIKPVVKIPGESEQNNRITMLVLSILSVFIAASVLFFAGKIILNKTLWQIFIWAVAPSSMLVYGYNRRTCKSRIFSALTFSFLIWSVLTALFLQLLSLNYNIWPVFILGIPLECMNWVFHLLKRSSEHEQKKDKEHKDF